MYAVRASVCVCCVYAQLACAHSPGSMRCGMKDKALPVKLAKKLGSLRAVGILQPVITHRTGVYANSHTLLATTGAHVSGHVLLAITVPQHPHATTVAYTIHVPSESHTIHVPSQRPRAPCPRNAHSVSTHLLLPNSCRCAEEPQNEHHHQHGCKRGPQLPAPHHRSQLEVHPEHSGTRALGR